MILSVAVTVLSLSLVPLQVLGQNAPQARSTREAAAAGMTSPDTAEASEVMEAPELEDTETISIENDSVGHIASPVAEQGDFPPAKARPGKDPSLIKGWEFYLTPYTWLPAAAGNSTVNGSVTKFNLSVIEELEKFKVFGLAGRLEVWKKNVLKGDLGLTVDGFGMSAKTSAKAGRDFVLFENRSRIPDVNKAIDINLDMDFVLSMTDFALSYRFRPLPLEKVHKKFGWRTLTFEPYAGVRYSYLKQEMKYQIISEGPLQTKIRKGKLGESVDWVEPFVGMGLKMPVVKRLNTYMRGDIGGFGFGSASKYTFNALAGLEYEFWRHGFLQVGYRLTGLDYERGSGSTAFGLDALLYGPTIGVTFRF